MAYRLLRRYAPADRPAGYAMNKLLNVIRKIREAGLGKARIIIADSIKRGVAPKLTDTQIVFRLDREAYAAGPPVKRVEGMAVDRYERIEEVPARLWQAMDREEASSMRAHFADEFANHGVVWIGVIDGQMAASQWSALGRFRDGWFVDLKPDDIVIYAASTRNAFRGRGIHPAMIRHIIENERDGGVDVYADTQVWNNVARRNIEKAGYRAFAEMPALKH